LVKWNELKYIYTVKNYGKSTAENVEVSLDLNYFKGQKSRIKELPPGESFDFTFNATLGDVFLNDVEEILRNEKYAVAEINITYKWWGITFSGEKYLAVIDSKSAYLFDNKR